MIVTGTTATCNYDFLSDEEGDGPLYITLKGMKDKYTEITGAYEEFIAFEARGVSLLVMVWNNQ